jgi:hypothetical protein
MIRPIRLGLKAVSVKEDQAVVLFGSRSTRQVSLLVGCDARLRELFPFSNDCVN